MTEARNFQLGDIHSLAQLRDELAVQAHLLQADAKQRWQGLELRFEKLQQEAAAAKEIAGKTREEVAAALKLAVDSLRKNYEDLKALIKH